MCSYPAARIYIHSRDEIQGFFGGLELVPPGVVSVRDWAGDDPALDLEPLTATFVAGFKAWQSLGRQVRKGERGIKILAPCFRRSDEDERPQRGERERQANANRQPAHGLSSRSR